MFNLPQRGGTVSMADQFTDDVGLQIVVVFHESLPFSIRACF
jgi:hypothetical protein